MKLIQYINEAFAKPKRATKIHFSSPRSWMMWLCEMQGQITDGKYSNTTPESHMNWVFKFESIIDGKEYYQGTKHRIKYDLSEWRKFIKRWFKNKDYSDDYSFSIRLYYYGKFGYLLANNDCEKIEQGGYNFEQGISYIAEYFGRNEDKSSINDINFPDYLQKYINIPFLKQFLTEEMFQQYKSINYDFKDFENDLDSMETSINTNKSEK